MLDDENTSTQPNTDDAQGSSPAPRRRRRAASRPAGPPAPVAAPESRDEPPADKLSEAAASAPTGAEAPASAEAAPSLTEPAVELPADTASTETPEPTETPAPAETHEPAAPARRTRKAATRKQAPPRKSAPAAAEVATDAPAADQPAAEAPAAEAPTAEAPATADQAPADHAPADQPAPAKRTRRRKTAAPATTVEAPAESDEDELGQRLREAASAAAGRRESGAAASGRGRRVTGVVANPFGDTPQEDPAAVLQSLAASIAGAKDTTPFREPTLEPVATDDETDVDAQVDETPESDSVDEQTDAADQPAAEGQDQTDADNAQADDQTQTADEAAEANNDDDNSDDDSSDDDSSDDDGSDDDSEGPRRRRRRRGGRRRRRGSSSSDDNDDDESSAGESNGSDESDSSNDDDSDDDASDSDASSDDDQPEGGRRRRRRRRRRGEDTGGSEDDPSEVVVRVREPRRTRSSSDEITSIEGSTRLEAKRQRRREGRAAGRRRAPILSEAEFLARRESVKRTMLIRQREDYTQLGVLEDDILVEHYVDRASATSLIGNVYLGRVQNVLPSMEAAFIDIGRGRNAVLYAGEVDWDSLGAQGSQRKIEQVYKSGQTVLVQVSKDPVGAKGARLTGHVSIPGRYVVYSPGGQLSGISRKLADTERHRLKDILGHLIDEDSSVIVRTAAEGASEDELVRDVTRLKAQWEAIEKRVKQGSAPQLLYSEPDLTVRIVRDLFTEDFAELVVQGDDIADTISDYVQHVAPHLAERLRRHDPETDGDVFAKYRVDDQIAKALERKVFLPSGGSLVIDRTEAMTVIDVNTGRFTGTAGNLEATVTSNNLEAAEEVVRQLRLRDIGGIIVIDFIDMVLPANRELLIRRLTECLARDRTRHQVAEVSSLGLVQMTRKKIGTGLAEAFTEECDHCGGRGYHRSEEPVDSQAPADGGDRSGRGRSRNNRRGGRGGDQSSNGHSARSESANGQSANTESTREYSANHEPAREESPQAAPASNGDPAPQQATPDTGGAATEAAQSTAPEEQAEESTTRRSRSTRTRSRRSATRPAGPAGTAPSTDAATEADSPDAQPRDEQSAAEDQAPAGDSAAQPVQAQPVQEHPEQAQDVLVEAPVGDSAHVDEPASTSTDAQH